MGVVRKCTMQIPREVWLCIAVVFIICKPFGRGTMYYMSHLVEVAEDDVLDKYLSVPTVVLIDARNKVVEDSELPGSVRIVTPMQVAPTLENIKKERALADGKSRPVVVYCEAGLRSWWAVDALKEHGFTEVINAGSYDRVAAAVERIQAAKWESKGLDIVNNKAVHPAGELWVVTQPTLL